MTFNKQTMRQIAQQRNMEFYRQTKEKYAEEIEFLCANVREQIQSAAEAGKYSHNLNLAPNRFPAKVTPRERNVIISEIEIYLKGEDFTVDTINVDYGDNQLVVKWL